MIESQHPKPGIFDTDQGSQFTGLDWIGELESNGIRISMNGKGRWMDNVFIERLWRSLKYERIRLYSYGTVGELKAHVAEWMSYYNHQRKHQHLGYQTPQADVSLTTPAPLPNKPPQNDQPPQQQIREFTGNGKETTSAYHPQKLCSCRYYANTRSGGKRLFGEAPAPVPL